MATKILKTISKVLKDKNFINKHREKKQDFTRNRKLSFEDIAQFVLGNLGTNMDFECLNFCKGRKKDVSVAALSKARDKIKYTAFEELLKETSEDIRVKHTFKGYRLTSYDGLKGELPRTADLMKTYTASKKNKYPQFHAVAEYDVLNCCYTNAIFKPGTTDERSAAIELFEVHSFEGPEIFLLDRGFPSVQMIQEIEKINKKYVMRVSKSFLKEVNNFGKSKESDINIQINYDKRRAVKNRVSGIEFPCLLKLRCIKIELESGKTEILITNLSDNEFSRKEIGELYNLRWKIEIAFLDLKYAIRIEDFMGIKENSIKQEFYASLIKANISMQIIGLANDILYNKKKLLSMNTKRM